MAFVEVSPHPVLTVAVEETVEGLGLERAWVVVVGSLRREEGGLERFVRSLAEAWVGGVGVDWGVLFAGSGARRVDLPRMRFSGSGFGLASGVGVGDVSGAGLGVGGASVVGCGGGVGGW